MTELEKKTLKAQTDFVQAVLEAYEKKNLERVEVLITNAIKQLKMSRFKPDQATCLGLTYLARTSPNVFTQSINVKEVLKALIRRDQGPTNMKGKPDVIIPVLAANILLACCDSQDIRTIILNKVEQWISGNQKVSDIVQHLLATLCMKCQEDSQTISSLVEIRQHWLTYLNENYDMYGSVPRDLSNSVKKLLKTEDNCESLITYLNFLVKHDRDIIDLCEYISCFILERPITLNNMIGEEKFGPELADILLKIYSKLLEHFSNGHTPSVKPEDAKVDVKLVDDVKYTTKSVFVKLPDCQEPVVMSKLIIQAIFSLLSSTILVEQEFLKEQLERLKNCWIFKLGKISYIAFIYVDASMSISYDLPDELRQRLIHSQDENLVEFAMRGASVSQLLMLLQQFGLSTKTINKVLSSIESVQDTDLIRAELGDCSYFAQLMEFYSTMGCPSANQLKDKLQLSQVSVS